MLKRIKDEVTLKNVKRLNKVAKRTAIGSVNTACSWIFDEPKVPAKLKKYRKF
ncbi:cyclic lactone autoinducer peptide [Mediterraneibacter glycyrrhizinilyticus]|nr:cyclic lactone autoinducer peptide [Mediterraneibacter glycyrrhizinilyticus]MBM6804436.1 cyclic lactone autoinducer peptide [Mediterraneibacter glycyrrhizinilyticus]